MAKDAPTQSEDEGGAPDYSPEATATRQAAGPMEILKLPDDDNPGLPPEVWQHPPAGYELPK
jgi:hypothetical protein